MVTHDSPHLQIQEAAALSPSNRWARSALFVFTMILLCLVTILGASNLQAEEKLETSVNQASIHESETLSLTVEGQVELELSLGALMNLRNLDLPEPDLGDLRASFDVLDQRQSYSVRSINGEHSAEVTWTYELAPRRTGELTIPSLSFKNARSEPIAIEVKPGSSAQADSRNPNAWVEADVSKREAFVQEQLVYTLRLYYLGSLVGGDLTEPDLDNAIVEPLGEQSQTTEFIDSRRYQVVERRYLVYPQRSGQLVLPAQYFTGRQRDPVTGTLRFLRAQSDPLTVEVLTPPGDFSGDQWIAAESLVVDENWSRSPDQLQVGDSLTRVLTVRTLGLLESALPLLDDTYPEQFNAYPEGRRSEAEINGDTIEASQVQTTALVAVKPGEATLPAIRLHWWDTLNDVARVAVIPEQTIEVVPAPGSNATQAPPAPTVEEEGDSAENQTRDQSSAPTVIEDTSAFNHWLTILAVFFALAWLVTLVLWLRNPSATATSEKEHGQIPGGIDLATLKQHAFNGRVETLSEIPAWVRQTFNRPDIHTLKETRTFFQDPELHAALDALEQHHFGGDQGGDWRQGPMLAAVLERLSKTRPNQERAETALPPFRRVPG